MIDKNRLQAKCSTWNIPLTGAQLDLLDRYAELLVSYNEKVNLTAITSPEGIEDRHFADSLLFAAQPEVSGRQYSHSTGSAATARALATSNCSRQILRAASSARSFANSTPVRPSSAQA